MTIFTEQEVLDILNDSDHLDDAKMAIKYNSKKYTRLVVVSEKAGRIIDKYFKKIDFSSQDDNKTLKVFIN